jgi:exodeoxyribonuclease VII small subunit
MSKKEINYKILSTELDEVLAKLQNPATTLDEAVDLYKQGQAIVKELEAYLSRTENVIRILSSETANTNL